MAQIETIYVPASKQYRLTLTEEEAKYIVALLNHPPSDISRTLGLVEYTPHEISRILNHGRKDGMCNTLRNAIYGDDDCDN